MNDIDTTTEVTFERLLEHYRLPDDVDKWPVVIEWVLEEAVHGDEIIFGSEDRRLSGSDIHPALWLLRSMAPNGLDNSGRLVVLRKSVMKAERRWGLHQPILHPNNPEIVTGWTPPTDFKLVLTCRDLEDTNNYEKPRLDIIAALNDSPKTSRTTVARVFMRYISVAYNYGYDRA
jgi:hypothetical protein